MTGEELGGRRARTARHLGVALLTVVVTGGAHTTPVTDDHRDELAAWVGAVARSLTGVAPGDTRWAWPLPGRHVLRPFDPPRVRWGAGHRGIDVLGAAGTQVRAVADGVVAYSGVIAGVGVVSVQHAAGLRSTYQPVEDPPAPGTRVRQGDPIGTLAPGGHCLLATCLHLGAVRGRDQYVDPLLLLGAWQLALLDPH